MVKPGKTLEIPITFYPRESISYRELIPFEINGLSQQVVEIKGKGTEMKVRDSWGDPQAGTRLLALPSHLGPSELTPFLSSPHLLALSCSIRGQPVPPRGGLSKRTQVKHRSSSVPNLLHQRMRVITGTGETFFLMKFETIRCSIPSVSFFSHIRACFVFRFNRQDLF